MRHPEDGLLRRVLTEPGGVGVADREHVAACPSCLDRLARLDADRAQPAEGPGTSARTPRGALRSLVRRPVVAAVAVGAVLAGAGAAAASDWLPVFRTEEVAPIAFSPDDLVALPDLSAYGEVEVTGDGEPREVADLDAAEAETGLDPPEVTDLPRGVEGEPAVAVGGEVTATFTFTAERAARAAADQGVALPPPPPGLDGSQVRLVAGPGVVQTWSHDAGVPSFLVARAVAPSATSSGVSFETARDYLLSLPGVPEDVAAQLRTFAGDGSTLPIPVPADRVASSSAEVGDAPATVLEAHDRTMAAVVWVEDGVVTVVAGAVDADEVLAVARGLR